MTEPPGKLRVDFQDDPDTDAEELAEVTGRLRRELLDLDVISVEPASSGQLPEDAKGVGLRALGELVVQFADADVLQLLVSTIGSWLGRQRHRRIKLTLDGDSLELTGVSSAEQQRLVDLWVNRHVGAD
jgi:hypothetical protein